MATSRVMGLQNVARGALSQRGRKCPRANQRCFRCQIVVRLDCFCGELLTLPSANTLGGRVPGASYRGCFVWLMTSVCMPSLRRAEHRLLLPVAALTPIQVGYPCGGSVLNIVIDCRAGRKIRRFVLVESAEVAPNRQIRDALGVQLLKHRRTRLLRMGRLGRGRLHGVQGIVRARPRQR